LLTASSQNLGVTFSGKKKVIDDVTNKLNSPQFMIPCLFIHFVLNFATFHVFKDWVGFTFEENLIKCECCVGEDLRKKTMMELCCLV
jgi:hypothetical protein